MPISSHDLSLVANIEDSVCGTEIGALSDDVILAHVADAARSVRFATVDVIVYLSEIERRGLHARKGFSSIYKFCLAKLQMSEDQAYRHITAVRLARTYPQILPMLESGLLHLTTLAQIKKHLTFPEDGWLIEAVAGKSKRVVQKLLATFFPHENHGPVQRIELLTAKRAKLEVLLDVATIEKLEECAAMMAHQHPQQTLDVVIAHAAELLYAKLKASRGESSRPQRLPRPAAPERVTQAARREAFDAANHQCTFVSDDGVRCDEKALLEVDHITPRAVGGTSKPENLRILCRSHNQYSAKQELGEEAIARGIAQSRARRVAEAKQRRAEHDTTAKRDDQQSDATSKLQDALTSMGFSSKTADTAVSRFLEQRPNEPFSDLGATLGELLRGMT